MCQAMWLKECPLLLQSVLGKSMCSARGSLAENGQEDLGFQTTNLGRVLAECNPYFSAVAVQINEKLSFETDVAVLFTFIVPNTLHILGLTSWSTCCYMSINHFLGESKEGLKTPCAAFLQNQGIVFRQPGITCDISHPSLPCPVYSVTMASPGWCSEGAGDTKVPLKWLLPAKVLLSLSPESLCPSGSSSATAHPFFHSLLCCSGCSGGWGLLQCHCPKANSRGLWIISNLGSQLIKHTGGSSPGLSAPASLCLNNPGQASWVSHLEQKLETRSALKKIICSSAFYS